MIAPIKWGNVQFFSYCLERSRLLENDRRVAGKQATRQTVKVPKEKLTSKHRRSWEDELDLLKVSHKFNLAETAGVNDPAESDNKQHP